MTPDRWMSKMGDWFVPVTETGCWIWMRSTNGVGYGKVSINGRLKYAHRVSYSLLVGPIPYGAVSDHLCRTRCCVNPWHLEMVDHRTNLLRGETTTARNASRTHCPKGHPYSGDNLKIGVNGNRLCRACQNAIKREAYRRRTPEQVEAQRIYNRNWQRIHRSKEEK